jgi:hypothetical protein
MRQRQRLTAQQWQSLFERQRVSGGSVQAFCRRHGVAVSTFFAWRRRLQQQADATATFVELTADAPADDGGGSAGSAIELVLPGAVTVRVRAVFDAAVLQQVVEGLR